MLSVVPRLSCNNRQRQRQVNQMLCVPPPSAARHKRQRFLRDVFSVRDMLRLLLASALVLGSGLANAVDSSIEKVVFANRGDTFPSIALRELGSSSMGRHLAEYNTMAYSKVLLAGSEIRIPLSTKPKQNYAEVVYTKGEAAVQPAGSLASVRKLATADRVYSSDVIKTGSDGFVSLVFASGSVVNVQPASEIRLSMLHCLESDSDCAVTLNASKGGLQSDVERRDGQPVKFLINTPHASAAVRGTIFDFNANSKEILVGVTEGEVDVVAAGVSVDLEEGLGVKAENGQPPGAPVSLLEPTRFSNVAPRVTVEDNVGWMSITGAQQYQYSMTLQPAGNKEQYSGQSAASYHSIESLAPGEYFLNVRALDENGLKGFVQSQKLQVAAIDAKLETPELAFDKQADTGFVIVQGDEAVSDTYEIQIARSPEFVAAISVDVPVDGGAVTETTDETLYARARAVISNEEVSAFGPVLEISPD